ncbi:hypothetical protein [Propionicimonas sp. T2.31MG-18]|uniref:hypothetical protein n=1 Tax=Propionicimonas sp. T2.31MG-18 TaxID=3157620 RepID=UPI00366C1152
MPKPADAIHLDPARQSPQLPALVATAQEIDGVTYPAAADVDSAAVVEDWLLHVEDALIEARNGVTAISWPLALAGLVGFLALLADVADGAPSILQAVVASPWKSLVCAALLVATIVAFRLSDETTEKRRKLVAIRSAYFRRRRELVEGQLASSSDDAHLVPGDRGVPKADGGVASTHEGR